MNTISISFRHLSNALYFQECLAKDQISSQITEKEELFILIIENRDEEDIKRRLKNADLDDSGTLSHTEGSLEDYLEWEKTANTYRHDRVFHSRRHTAMSSIPQWFYWIVSIVLISVGIIKVIYPAHNDERYFWGLPFIALGLFNIRELLKSRKSGKSK